MASLIGRTSCIRQSPSFTVYSRFFHAHARLMSSAQPPWLAAILTNTTPPPKLYAWTLPNVGLPNERETPTNNDLARRIFILGLGNMGRLYATYLAKCPDSPPITLVLHRRDLLQQWHSSPGVELARPHAGVTERNRAFDVEWWTDEKPTSGPVREVASQGHEATPGTIRNLIIATKATNAIPETDRVRRYLDGRSVVALAQNGMSKLWPPHGPSYVSQRFSPGKGPSFVALITRHGVISLSDSNYFSSVHASPADVAAGPVRLGQAPDAASQVDYFLSKVASAPHLNSTTVPRADLWVLQLEKLVVNSIINPLTAILRCQNGALFPSEPNPDADGLLSLAIMDKLVRECSTVLRALLDHDSSAAILQGSGTSPLTATRSTLKARFSFDSLRSMLHGVGAKVRDNTSSMLQDVQSGRTTEVRDFNGWLVDTAAFVHNDDGAAPDVSTHRLLIDLVEGGKPLTFAELGQRLLP